MVVAAQTCQHANDSKVNEIYQSTYKACHITETALLKVHNDILRAIDKENSVILFLLDLSVAYDTVDTTFCCRALHQGLELPAKLMIVRSYLTNRTLTVKVSGVVSLKWSQLLRSSTGECFWRSSQCTMGETIRLHSTEYHLYTDDTLQILVTFTLLVRMRWAWRWRHAFETFMRGSPSKSTD